MQLGNNERVADNHEKTREEKENDVDQAVVHLRCEVWVLDESSMPTILAKFLPASICSRWQTIIRSGDLFGIWASADGTTAIWTSIIKVARSTLIRSDCQHFANQHHRLARGPFSHFAFCKSSSCKRTFFAVWTLTGTPVLGSQISRVGKVSWHSDQLASNGEYWGVKKD